jgi:hypothetical protein
MALVGGLVVLGLTMLFLVGYARVLIGLVRGGGEPRRIEEAGRAQQSHEEASRLAGEAASAADVGWTADYLSEVVTFSRGLHTLGVTYDLVLDRPEALGFALGEFVEQRRLPPGSDEALTR